MKPILFNTEMVCAILDNRKTVTQRVVRGINNSADFFTLIDNPSVIAVDKHGQEYPKDVKGLYANFVHDGDPEYPLVKAPYRTGDILYVQETWNRMLGDWIYKADQKLGMKNPGKWRPSIYMPREAARIFLRVTDVKVERLQEIDDAQAVAEGAEGEFCNCDGSEVFCSRCCNTGWLISPRSKFPRLWDSTIKPADRAYYGWTANPWVYVIKFERISREEAE